METLTLYGTNACHLCELAEAQLDGLLSERDGFIVAKVDIADSEALFERYGVLIPVLRRDASGEELHWPFSPDDIRSFILR